MASTIEKFTLRYQLEGVRVDVDYEVELLPSMSPQQILRAMSAAARNEDHDPRFSDLVRVSSNLKKALLQPRPHRGTPC